VTIATFPSRTPIACAPCSVLAPDDNHLADWPVEEL
jgi:hypothetical protein